MYKELNCTDWAFPFSKVSLTLLLLNQPELISLTCSFEFLTQPSQTFLLFKLKMFRKRKKFSKKKNISNENKSWNFGDALLTGQAKMSSLHLDLVFGYHQKSSEARLNLQDRPNQRNSSFFELCFITEKVFKFYTPVTYTIKIWW